MSKSHETIADSDAYSVEYETVLSPESCDSASEEINTYDPIPIAESNVHRRKTGVLKRLYSIVAVLTLLLSVIFSSAELMDVMINDTGAGNMILRRIFGAGISGDSFDLCELIISNSFLSVSDDIPAAEETSPKSEISDSDIPNQDSTTTDKPLTTASSPKSHTDIPSGFLLTSFSGRSILFRRLYIAVMHPPVPTETPK